jgi:hypothetical protein
MAMEQLQTALLILITLGAVADVLSLAAGLNEFRTGRLSFLHAPFRRRVPVTAEDVRKNGLAVVLNAVGALLVSLLVISALFLDRLAVDPIWAAGYLIVGLAAFLATFLLSYAAFHIRSQVRFGTRGARNSIQSVQN